MRAKSRLISVYPQWINPVSREEPKEIQLTTNYYIMKLNQLKTSMSLATAMGSLALTAVTANAAMVVTDFSNFSESGSLIAPPHTLDQAFTPSGADIAITMASLGNTVGQEVFLSDEFATLTVGDRVSIDVPASLGGETDAGLAISSIEGLTTRENLFVWVLQNGGNVAVYNFDDSGALKSQTFGVADAPDTLFIDKTATGWSFGTIFGGTETFHLTDVSEVGGDDIDADGSALGLWSDMRGDTPRTLSNLTVPGVIPEPSTTALLGLGGLALLRRRRR
jgi:hypothetical protein